MEGKGNDKKRFSEGKKPKKIEKPKEKSLIESTKDLFLKASETIGKVYLGMLAFALAPELMKQFLSTVDDSNENDNDHADNSKDDGNSSNVSE